MAAPTALILSRPGVDPNTPHPNDGPRPVGKPPARYSQGLHRDIVKLVIEGNTPQTAAASAGLPRSIFNDWMRRGSNGDPHLAQFYEDIERACAVAETTHVEKIRTEGGVDDSKWWLERARPRDWAKTVTLQVNAELEGMLLKLQAALPPAQYEQIIGILSGEISQTASQATESREDEDGD